MRNERERKRSPSTAPTRTRGPKPKPSRDSALLEQRAQLVLLHRRQQRLRERLELERQQTAALRQQVEGLRQRWEDTCGSNQQLHKSNLQLHEQLAAAAQAHGITLPLESNPMQPQSWSAARPEPLSSCSYMPGLPVTASHPTGVSGNAHMALMPVQPPAATAAAAGACGGLDRNPFSPQGHPLALSSSSTGSSSSSCNHSSPTPRMPPMPVPSMPRAGSAPAWWPGHMPALASPPPPAAAAAPGPLEARLRQGGRCNNDGGLLPAASAGWGDAYSRVCSWGPSPALHSSRSGGPLSLPGHVEGVNSHGQLRPVERAPHPSMQGPYIPAPPAPVPAAAAAAEGELYMPGWPLAPGGQAAAAAGGGQGPALFPPGAALGYGGYRGGPQVPLPLGSFTRSGPGVPQQLPGPVYESHCIRQPLPGLPEVQPVEPQQQQQLLLLEPTSASAMVTRVCKQSPFGTCSGDVECHLQPAITPGGSFEKMAGQGGSPVMCGTPFSPAGLHSWPSTSSMMGGGTVLGGGSPLSSPDAASGAAAGGVVMPKGQALPVLGTTAAAGVDAVMDVGPEDVEQLLDSLLEQEDASWLKMLGGEGMLV